MASESDYNAYHEERQMGSLEVGRQADATFDDHPSIQRTKTWQERVQKRTRGAAEDDDELIIQSVASCLSDVTHMTQMTDYTAMREAEEERRKELGLEEEVEEEEEGLSDPQGFLIVCGVIFAGDMARGILFPTLWPLLKYVGGQKSQHGLIVAATSVGRILSSPYFGSASEKYGYRSTLITSQCILLLGSLLYTFTVPVHSPIWLFFSMLTIGIGSGTLGVTRAFVSDIVPKHMRTKYIAYLTAVQFGGFTITPFLGSLYVYLFQDKDLNGLFNLNMFSAPSYTMVMICLLNVLSLYMFLTDRKKEKKPKIYKKVPSHVKRAAMPESVRVGQQPISWLGGIPTVEAVYAFCMFFNMISKGSFGAFESLGVIVADDLFGLGSDQAGYTVASFGICGTIILLLMGKIGHHVTDTQMTWVGTLVMTFGCLAMIHWPGNDIPMAPIRYYLGIFCIYGLGYPMGHTANIGLFSKIIGNQPQGTLQGWFATSGSVARVIFPVTACLMYAQIDSNAIFYTLAILTLGGVVAVLYLSRLLNILST